jgi:hypothetical protein
MIIILPEQLTLMEFVERTREVGVLFETLKSEVEQGRLSKGADHVWIFEDETILNDYNKSGQTQLLSKMLGSEPRGCIVFELSSGEDSIALAKELAKFYSERYPCVIELNNRLYKPSEL